MDLHVAYLRRKFWIKDFFSGSPVRKPYAEIKAFNNMRFEDAENFRKLKLEDLLTYAQNHTQFYSKYPSLNLKDYPIMNKSTLLDRYEEICVPIEDIPGQSGRLHVQSTSGSTGTPFKIPQDYRKRQRRIAELKYFGEIVGFKSHEMLIHLRTWNRWQSKNQKQIKSENIIPFDISKMGDGELGELCRIINKNKAVCLRGYASSFDILARYMKEHNIECPSVRIIIAGSETLHDDVRDRVKSVMLCEIISQYANEECGILAQERVPTKASDNPMYLNHANYIFECLKFDSDESAEYGELGRLVVTDFNNYAFPIIRYDTGDAAIFLEPDKYSNGFPVLGKLLGRRLDLCYTVEGKPLSPMMIGRVLKHYDQIKQWQFIQKGQKEYLLKVILRDGIEHNSLNDAVITLQESLGIDAEIKIEKVEDIPTLQSGKRKPVVNEWKK